MASAPGQPPQLGPDGQPLPPRKPMPKHGPDGKPMYGKDGKMIMDESGVPGGPPPREPYQASKKLQQTQAQVDDVVDIMRVNVDKVLERDQKLSELDDRADALQAGAAQFEAKAGALKRKMWWKNLKMMLIMGAIVVVVIIIIVVWAVTSQQK